MRSLLGVGLAAMIATGAAAQDLLDVALERHAAGELRPALDAYDAFVQGEAAAPLDAGIALTNACAIRLDLGALREAREDCDRAVRRLDGTGEDDLLAQALNNGALAAQRLGDLDEARAMFLRALATNQRIDMPAAVAVNLANLGALATLAGRLGDSLSYYERLEALARRHELEDWAERQLAVAMVNRGVVFQQIGEHRRAMDLYLQLEGRPGALGTAERATLFVNLATTYRNLGDPVTAARYLDEAAALHAELDDPAGEAAVALNQGIVEHLNLKAFGAAEAAYDRALALAQRTGDQLLEIETRVYLGRLEAAVGRTAPATRHLEAALALARDAELAEGEGWAQAVLASVLVDADPVAAVDLVRAAIASVARMAGSLEDRPEQSSFVSSSRELLEIAVTVMARIHVADPTVVGAEEALQVAHLAKAWEMEDRLRQPVLTADPRDLVSADSRASVAVEYLFTADQAYAWSVGADVVRLHALGRSSPLLEMVERVRADLFTEAGPRPSDLRALADTLLAPVAHQLARTDRLYVAPDGPLSYFPFDLLPDPAGGIRMLIDDLEIVYLPVVARLGGGQAGVEVRRQFVGFVPAGAASEAANALFGQLPPLPQAIGEVTAARSALGGDVRQGGDATERAVLEALRDGVEVLHIAAHSVLDDAYRRGGAVVLSPDPSNDGLLFADEIAGARGGYAGLVVLAGCGTAVGSAGGLSSLSSLSGAFLMAGSQAVVASLWDVDDAASAALMSQLYWELGQGTDTVAAVRRAKLRLRDAGLADRPAAWAAYVIVGDGGTVNSDSPTAGFTRGLAWGLLLAAAGLLLLPWWRRAAGPRRAVSRRSPP